MESAIEPAYRNKIEGTAGRAMKSFSFHCWLESPGSTLDVMFAYIRALRANRNLGLINGAQPVLVAERTAEEAHRAQVVGKHVQVLKNIIDTKREEHKRNEDARKEVVLLAGNDWIPSAGLWDVTDVVIDWKTGKLSMHGLKGDDLAVLPQFLCCTISGTTAVWTDDCATTCDTTLQELRASVLL